MIFWLWLALIWLLLAIVAYLVGDVERAKRWSLFSCACDVAFFISILLQK